MYMYIYICTSADAFAQIMMVHGCVRIDSHYPKEKQSKTATSAAVGDLLLDCAELCTDIRYQRCERREPQP